MMSAVDSAVRARSRRREEKSENPMWSDNLRLRICAIFVMALALVGAAANAGAQVTVEVSHTGDDVLGQRLAFELREQIRSSSGFTLVQNEGGYQIAIITLAVADGSDGPNRMAASVSYLWKDPNTRGGMWLFLTSTVHIIGGSRIKESATGILATLDGEVETIKKAFSRLPKK
jgi:hypothetical protein